MTEEREAQLDQILAEFLERRESGDSVDVEDLVQGHPEFATLIRDYFADEAQLREAAKPLAMAHVSRRPVLGTLRYFGDYELLEEVARGGMGIVYRARQKSLNRIVAVKMILAGNLATEQDIRRFQTEAESAARLKHPHIVTVHEVGRHQGQHYFSMDFIEGQNLAELTRDRPVTAQAAARFTQQIAEAIDSAHQQGTLHRDLKPSNILIDSRNAVQITDFGLALPVEGDSALTRTGQVLGTPSYMSPEQARGQRGLIGPGSDIYSLGAILYELLTGRPPFRAESAVETLRQVIEDEPLAPRLLNPAVPKDLETICLKCLEKEPHKRYGTAQLLAEELQRYRNGQPILARPIGRGARLWRWAKRHPASAGLAVTTAIAALAIVGLGVSARDYFRLQESYERETRLRGEKEAALTLAVEAQQQLEGANAEITQNNVKLEKLNTKLNGLNVELQQESREKSAALDRAESLSYALHVGSAQRAWRANNVARAEMLLDACPQQHRDWEWWYLKKLCHLDRQTLTLTSEAVDLSTTPDGAWLAAVTDDQELLLFRKTKHGYQPAKEFQTDQNVTCAKLLAEQGSLLVGRDNGHVDVLALPDGGLIESIRLLDGLPDSMIMSVKAPECRVTTVDVNRDGVFVAASFSLKTYEENRTKYTRRAALWLRSESDQLHLIGENVDRVTFSPDGSRVAVALGRYDWLRRKDLALGKLVVWDTHSREEIVRLRPERGTLPAALCAVFADAQTLITGHSDSTIRCWDVDSGRQVHVLENADGPIWDLTVLPDGQLAAATSNQVLRFWKRNNDSEFVPAQIIRGHRGDVTAICGLADGKTVLSSSSDATIKVWQADIQAVCRQLNPANTRRAQYVAVAFSPNGKQLAWSDRHSIWFQSLDSMQIARKRARTPQSLAFAPDSRRILAGGTGPALELFDTNTFELVRSTRKRSRVYSSRVAFSSDNRHVAIATHEGVSIWNLADNGPADVFPVDPSRMISDVTFSPDGQLVAFGLGYRGNRHVQVVVYDRESHNVIHVLRPRSDAGEPIEFSLASQVAGRTKSDELRSVGVYDVEFSPDGKRIAAAICGHLGHESGMTYVWELGQAQPIFELQGHRFGVWSLSFSPDGRRLATGAGIWAMRDASGEIKLWEMEHGHELITLERHRGAVMSLDFSPDGKLLASASCDGSVRLWGADLSQYSAGLHDAHQE